MLEGNLLKRIINVNIVVEFSLREPLTPAINDDITA